METYSEKAVQLYKSHGYNCAQAVVCAYADLINEDEKTLFRISEGFGHGMGCFEGTCGAVVGACMLVGLKNSTANLAAPDSKAATSKLSKQVVQAFKKKHGTILCRELKGIDTGKVLCPCIDCIKDASELAEEILTLST